MGWFDDLTTRAQQAVNDAQRDIQSYIENRAVDQVVKVAEEQKGNLTALQIAAGQYGGSTPVASPAASASQTSNAAQASQIAMAGMGIGTLVAIGVAAYFIFGSKSRG